jgi:ribonucleoside-triphosphate reductase
MINFGGFLMKNSNDSKDKVKICNERTEIYSRVCGFFRPIFNYNKGKKQEFKDRKNYEI